MIRILEEITYCSLYPHTRDKKPYTKGYHYFQSKPFYYIANQIPLLQHREPADLKSLGLFFEFMVHYWDKKLPKISLSVISLSLVDLWTNTSKEIMIVECPSILESYKVILLFQLQDR